MTKINIQPDCGNAPRKLFLKNLHVAFANGDIDYVSDIIPLDITWVIVGYKNVSGKKDYLTELIRHKSWKVEELIIDTIITHGVDASISGQIITSENKKISFSEVYKFKTAGSSIIKSITTFMIAD